MNDYTNISDQISELSEKIIAEQNAKIDRVLLEMLDTHNIQTSNNTEEMKEEMRHKGFELLNNIERNGEDTTYTIKLCRIIDQRKIIIKKPKINIT